MRMRGMRSTSRRSQSWPIAMPIRLSGMPCGQLKLISNASTPVSSQRSINSSQASLLYSSMIDAMSTLQPTSMLRILGPWTGSTSPLLHFACSRASCASNQRLTRTAMQERSQITKFKQLPASNGIQIDRQTDGRTMLVK